MRNAEGVDLSREAAFTSPGLGAKRRTWGYESPHPIILVLEEAPDCYIFLGFFEDPFPYCHTPQVSVAGAPSTWG